jgi:ribonuclease P protein component
MSASVALTLSKEERLCSRTLIDRLFNGGGSRSMTAFPLRMVYLKTDREPHAPQVQMMVSVPKRCFKRAVKRNRVKRQVREAFRKQKSALLAHLEAEADQQLILAFIWLDARLYDSQVVEQRVGNLIERASEKL